MSTQSTGRAGQIGESAGGMLSAIAENMVEGLYVIDADRRMTYLNAAAERMTGWTRDELIGKPPHETLHFQRADGTPYPATECPLIAVTRTGEPANVEDDAFTRKDGTIFPVAYSSSPLTTDGKREGAVIVFRETTARKRAEAELEQRRQRQEAVVQLGMAALEAGNLAALTDKVARTVAEVLGADCCEVLEIAADRESLHVRSGVGWNPGVVGSTRVPYSTDVYAAFALGSPNGAFTGDYAAEPRFRPSRVLVDHGVKSSAAVTIGRRGLPNGVLGVHFRTCREVSQEEVGFLKVVANILAEAMERDRAAGHLAASERRYRHIVETANEGIWVYDADRVTTFVNSSMAKMLGNTVSQMQGRPVLDFIHEADRPKLTRVLERGESGSEELCDTRLVHRDGTEVWGLVSSTPLPEKTGMGGLAMISDITERVEMCREKTRLEADLNQVQRMDCVGQLAGGIAHDFNNILAVVQGYAEFALAEVEGPVRDDIEEIRRAAERAAGLTRQLLVFSRRSVTAPEIIYLGDVIADTEKLLARTLGAHIELVTDTSGVRLPIKADPSQIEQVLVNLALNARDAMPDGGTLLMQVANETPDDEVAMSSTQTISTGEYVSLTVNDTGTGMAKETRERAFEPFFTTKGPSRGTGLGLASVYGVVKQSDGYIGLYSEEGLGTTVKIYLPVTAESAGALCPPSTDPSGGDGQVVLVVEDEAPVRELTRRILERHGYAVLSAGDGEQALRLLLDPTNPIVLLLTDLVMPGMAGSELARRASSLLPALSVVYMSGYTDDLVIRNGMNPDDRPLLQKPFGSSALLRRVAATLDARPTRTTSHGA